MTADAREALLHEGATAVGESWVAWMLDEMRTARRPAAGGWPGTIPEARARVGAYLGSALYVRGMVAATAAELERATRTAYTAARRGWLARAQHDV